MATVWLTASTVQWVQVARCKWACCVHELLVRLHPQLLQGLLVPKNQDGVGPKAKLEAFTGVHKPLCVSSISQHWHTKTNNPSHSRLQVQFISNLSNPSVEEKDKWRLRVGGCDLTGCVDQCLPLFYMFVVKPPRIGLTFMTASKVLSVK